MADTPAAWLPATGMFRHVGFFYRTGQEYAATVARFLRDGLAEDAAVFVAVPEAKADAIRDALGADAPHVEFAAIAQKGRDLAWIIPRVQAFVYRHPGRRVRYVGEPVWASSGAAELREARHEALINLVFAAADARILCPYDTAALAPSVIADARRTHPQVLSDGHQEATLRFAVPFQMPASRSRPLPAPPSDAMSHTYRTNLSEVRALVYRHAMDAGLPEARANDLVLAVSEVAANTLRHTPSSGTLDIWRDRDEVVCEVHDSGTITDPLAGRRTPAPDASGGHGLWLVYQVCDLVELRSDSSGTTVRMHMAVDPPMTGI